MPTQVDFSEIESNILGLRIGRCNNDNFDENALYGQITEGNYDLCRLKVPAEDEMASLRLNKMGLPFYFSGSIRRYKTKISGPPPGQYFYDDLVFETYDGTQEKLLKQMLDGTWGTYPLGYYRTPYLERLVTKEGEIESVFQYYKKHNLKKDYPDKSILFIRHGDLYVGFFALNIIDGNLESHIGGILEPYRKSNYFLDMLRYIKEFCIREHLEYFSFGARNENAQVQRIFQYVGFTALGSENVFHIPALLTHSQKPIVTKEIVISGLHRQELQRQLYTASIEFAANHAGDFSRTIFRLNDGGTVINDASSIKVRFSVPVINDSEVLVVLKSEGKDTFPLTGYLSLNK